jgi:hypothetical protein
MVKLDKKSVHKLAKIVRQLSGKKGMGWSFTMGEGKLTERVNHSLVKKMIKAVDKGEDVVVYDKKGKRYTFQGGDNKYVSVTDHWKDGGNESSWKDIPHKDIKKIVSEGKLKEEILKGGVVSGGGSEAALDVIRAMTRGNNLRVGELSNMTNWLGQYKDGVEFGLKKKMKVGGKVVSIVQIKKTGKDKFTIAYLDWDDGKRPLLTRKIDKNVSAKNLPRELKRNVKVG